MKFNVNTYQEVEDMNKLRTFKIHNANKRVKKDLMVEALDFIVSKCLESEDIISYDRDAQKSIIEGLLGDFSYEYNTRVFKRSSYLLSEMVDIVDKYVTLAESEVKEVHDPDIYTLDLETKDKFYKELDGLDLEDAEYVIAKRVRNNIYDYIRKASLSKEMINTIIDDTKRKLDSDEGKLLGEQTRLTMLGEASRKKAAITERLQKSLYGKILAGVSECCVRTLSDEAEKKGADSISKGDIDYGEITKKAQTLYGTLEVLHGLKTNFVEINKLNDYIDMVAKK